MTLGIHEAQRRADQHAEACEKFILVNNDQASVHATMALAYATMALDKYRQIGRGTK